MRAYVVPEMDSAVRTGEHPSGLLWKNTTGDRPTVVEGIGISGVWGRKGGTQRERASRPLLPLKA
jgi:hypothetical protein